MLSTSFKGAEVGWHSADIVEDKYTLLICSPRQDLGITQSSQVRRLNCQEIQRRFPAEYASHNRFVEIGVRQKSNFHVRRVVCSSSRAWINLSRKLAGSNAALRLPSAHFAF